MSIPATLLLMLTSLLLGLWLGRWRNVPAAPAATVELEPALQRERERIYADLHDDLGAKLLELVYRAADPAQADVARAALQDLRDVVSRSRGCPASLLEALSEIELEARQRLELAGIQLDWSQPEDLPDVQLDRAQNLHLFRILREALSNVIRHSQATHLRVRLIASAQALRLELTDDGDGAGQLGSGRGAGTANMRSRAAELQGKITWRGATAGGTRVILTLPLQHANR